MIAEPECNRRRCKHLWGVEQPDGTEVSERVVCAAFPSGIPATIAFGTDLHLVPHPKQDNDIVYEAQ